jgi:RNA polymerase sigma factor (sigma-70 family)
MDLQALIYRVRAGDPCAFTELVRRYQDLAFGYAFSLLRDFQLAEDAAQEAFLAVYAHLNTLETPGAFPGWLRSIVRNQCGRIRRKRRSDVVPLDQARDMAAPMPGPEHQAETNAMREQVLAAIKALPQAQREVTTLYYIREYSQQEIATFLGVPVTQVNNRLHAARTRLKRRMLPMVKETLQQSALPADFAERVGKIVQVQGPIIEAQFAPEALPAIFSALTVSDPSHPQPVTVEVAQHLENGIVRCIALAPAEGLARGLEVVSTGGPAGQPVSAETLSQIVTTLSKTQTTTPEILETGIKVIDMFCPYARYGKVGLFAEWGIGMLVLVAEVLHNIATHQGGVSLFTFVQPKTDLANWQETIQELPIATGDVQTIYLPTEDPSDPQFVARFDFLDATTYLSRRLAAQRFYPAVDPLHCHSRLLDPAIVGQEHVDVANGVRQLLQRYQELSAADASDNTALSPEDQTVIARTRRIERFLTQPFFVAEPYTQQPGQYVSREETVQGLKALLSGEYDDLPEEAFLYCGPISQARER